MIPEEQHDELRDLLTDAVADVEPTYRLDVIRARTSRRPSRRGWYAAGTAVLASAAAVAVIAMVNGPNHSPVPGPSAPDDTRVEALYFVGDTPTGPRLYREWQQVTGGPLAALEAITRGHGPDDPDYRTAWPEGSFESVDVGDRAITVELGEPAQGARFRNPLWTQQVVYTVQAATGSELPVRFTPSKRARPVQRAPQNDVLALVSISDPVEGQRVTGSFLAQGRANSFEATVPWQLRRGDEVVAEGSVTAEGAYDRLYPWQTRIDVSELEPGRYTFVAMTDDPSGGAEGGGPTYDTRTIIVE